jgi:uncharacterized repeat protein (TIGR03943 family)
VRRETQHVLLVLLGGALLRIAVDDTHLRYVRPEHRPVLVAAGAVMVVLAVVALVRDRTATHEAAEHDHGAGDRHAPWLLLAPVLVIALVAPPALGADAVTRAGPRNAVVQASDAFGPLPPGHPVEISVAEFVERAVWDRTDALHGREVVLTGFAVRRGADVELARMTIACCAADARPNRVRLAGDTGEPAADTWLQVRGVLEPGSTGADQVPTLAVTAVSPVAAPPDPYEY